jgi:hypothetical protein
MRLKSVPYSLIQKVAEGEEAGTSQGIPDYFHGDGSFAKQKSRDSCSEGGKNYSVASALETHGRAQC